MKQHITKKQWDELSDEQEDEYLNSVNHHDPNAEYPSIGEMIEFLGEVGYKRKSLVELVRMYDEKERGLKLCDLLWEAVKYKLKI